MRSICKHDLCSGFIKNGGKPDQVGSRTRTIYRSTLILILLFSWIAPVSASEEDQEIGSEGGYNFNFRRSWGGEAGQFRSPSGVAIANDGTIYVANTGLSRIEIIDPVNRTMKILGGSALSGQIENPTSITVDSVGNIYLGNSVNFNYWKILKIASNGVVLTSWGYYGTGNGEFGLNIGGIAVDGSGNIYAADTDNDRIQKFTADGNYITEWGSQGNGNGQFNKPTGVAVDGSGNVYVADTGNFRIQKFSASGAFLKKWGSSGSGNGQFNHPSGIAVDGNGNVYVTDSVNHRLQKFSSEGAYLSQVGSKGSGQRQFDTPMGIAVDKSGSLYIAETGNDRVQKLAANLTYRTQWASWDNGNGQFDHPGGIAVDSSGNFYVADTYNNRIRKFNANWRSIMDWGSAGSGNGQFNRPRDVAVDASGNIYVADAWNFRIQKFNPNGTYITQWNQNILWPWGVGVDKNNFIYVADMEKNASYKYTADGVYQMQLTNNCDTRDIAVGGNGYIYVVDDCTISVFSPTGGFLNAWWNGGSGDGQFSEKESIAIHESGDLFVVDSNNQRVQILDPGGNFLYKWGSQGNGVGQFRYPSGIALGKNDTVFVSDRDNSRVQVFAPGLPATDPYTGAVQNGEFERILEDAWTYGGTLPTIRSTHAFQGSYALQLGQEDGAHEQGEGQAWAHTTLYVPSDWDHPTLFFRYNMYVNDILDYSDFFVAIQDGVGLNHLATVLRDGYQPCTPGVAPTPRTNLGWRLGGYDLSAYKGQFIRLVFSNRNLWPDSLGIWTYVDDVRVIDTGPTAVAEGPFKINMPLVTNTRCDPIPASSSGSLEFLNMRPPAE